MGAANSYVIDRGALESAHAAVRLQKTRLPEPAIRSLAEEVVLRLSARFERPADRAFGRAATARIEKLADALVAPDEDAALDYVRELKAKGVPLDLLYERYIAGAARLLGARWEADEALFTDVTVGAGRLYVVMRALRPPRAVSLPTADPHGPALFVSAPGEDHTLGVTMAAEMFRKEGWQIALHTGAGHDELVDIAKGAHFPVIGVSASSERMLPPLVRLIASLRIVAPHSGIVVSGKLTGIEPELAQLVDADASVSNAAEAFEAVERLAAAAG